MALFFSSKNNPAFLILFFLSSLLFLTTQQCNHHHFSALLHLKHRFNFIDDYTLSTLPSWNSNNTDCCSWERITCDGPTGHVISLDLSVLWIRGRIDFESLFRLRSLQKLNLAYNDFDGSPIPSGFDQLTSLTHLNLSWLSFYGQIPLEISRLTSLVSLDLSRSQYWNGSGFQYLKLENPSIGAVVQNLSNLSELYLDWLHFLSKLDLSRNNLSSAVPSFPLHFLSELDLSGNNLSSAVPSFPGSLRKLSLIDLPNFIGNLSTLTSLLLKDCGLHGKFPESVFQLPNLQIIDISGNPLVAINLPEFPQNNTLQQLILSYTGLSGKLPDSLSNLKFLTHLGLSNCNLSGSLPSSLWNLTKLQYLSLSSNKLSGPIPSSYGNELLNLKVINLWNNLLNGTIPSSLLSLPSLQRLDLGGNQLSGQLGEFHSSSQLENLYLDSNKFQGMIPRFIFQLTNLRELYLSSNDFSGVVELGLFQNLKNLYSLDLSDNNLSVQYGSGNSTFVSIPQFGSWLLRSCNICTFPNFLRNQEQLRQLNLSNNKISGEIPKWIWEVGNGSLNSLNLSHNVLWGVEPSPHLSLSYLSVLDISSNKLEGSLPIPPPSIFFFSVSNNNLGGEIPRSICNATSLTVLDLSQNHFIGQIPPCLGEIGGTLSVLNLQGNAFNGTLLQTFKEGCNIQTLDLSENQLKGQVPKSLANCKMLEVLNLGKNQIHDTFPLWLEALSQLRVLVLRSNQFHGTIGHPQAFPLLQIFDLSFNSFEGNLPSNMFKSWKAMIEEDKSQSLVLGKMIDDNRSSIYYQNKVSIVSKGLQMKLVKILTAFTVVDLSENKFHGDIPESIGDLKSLLVLNMSNNDLTGGIPTSFQNLRDLESLDLSHNKLSGEIPWQLTELTFLEVLNLSQNFLVGKIPQSQQFLTFNSESFKENLGLCGPPLSKKCEDAESAPPSALSTLQSERKYDWELMWIGFGVGHGVGVGMLFWTLALWRKGRREFYIFIDRMFFLIFPSMVFPK
ncbi:receptor-like protein 7 [Magnolia sinica]|uniref:receptor-like protein 7 n=1 Tax=Magnolia sinica TaxID=86752 RepID=UPI00265952E1|nr:receptor-like protein 7 [Magnolia sinica]